MALHDARIMPHQLLVVFCWSFKNSMVTFFSCLGIFLCFWGVESHLWEFMVFGNSIMTCSDVAWVVCVWKKNSWGVGETLERNTLKFICKAQGFQGRLHLCPYPALLFLGFAGMEQGGGCAAKGGARMLAYQPTDAPGGMAAYQGGFMI